MNLVLKTSKLFNARTQKPLLGKNLSEDLRDGDKIIQLDPDNQTTIVGIIRNPYFVMDEGWGYSIEEPSGPFV